VQFADVASASAYYASRYAEYAAGRLAPEQLEQERAAIFVVDPAGVRWRMNPSGQWVADAPPSAPAGHRGRTIALVVAGVLALLVVVGLVAGGDDSGGAGPAATPSVAAARAPGLAGVLQAGGVVVYLRHAAREEVSEEVTSPADCSQQANLTDAGREQAKRTGAALRALGVRVASVASSPYCRTKQTAELAFGAEPTLVPELSGATLEPPIPADARRATLLRLLGDAPPAGQIRVVVGHSEVLTEVTGVPTLDFAELAVFRPGPSGPQLVGRLTYDQLIGVACVSGRC
jgi:phosphohistidine phosphatase SixA